VIVTEAEVGLVFADGFERDDLAPWTAVAP
jgi:hypothetical protein